MVPVVGPPVPPESLPAREPACRDGPVASVRESRAKLGSGRDLSRSFTNFRSTTYRLNAVRHFCSPERRRSTATYSEVKSEIIERG